MIHTIAVPPDSQNAPLLRAYEQALAAKRRQLALGFALALAALFVAGVGAEVDLATLWDKIGNFTSYFARMLHLDSGGWVWSNPREWFWGLGRWTRLLGETLLIAYVGTITGAIAGFLGCFLASRNLVRSPVLGFVARRLLEFCRSVPDIVFAMIFVVAYGIGALPGVLALALHTTGALGKLFSEVVENIDMEPVDGIAATGATWVERVRFAVLPQVLSNFASYTLLRFEINVRGATVIGFVGAGGIGQEFLTAIRSFYYSDISAILLLITGCVMLIDLLSEWLRHRLLALETRP